MRDARCLTLHVFVTYRGFFVLLGFLLILTALLGCFTSFSAVHQLALLGPLKCLDLDLPHLHIQDAHYFSPSQMSNINDIYLQIPESIYSQSRSYDQIHWTNNQTIVLEEEGNLDHDAKDDYSRSQSDNRRMVQDEKDDAKDDYKSDPREDLLNSTSHHDDYDGDLNEDLLNSTKRYLDAAAIAVEDDGKSHPKANLVSSNTSSCTKSSALLKVYMYDLPPQFHFGMIEPMDTQNGTIWPRRMSQLIRYPGGLYEQHSPEYWVTLDLLINTELESLDDGTLSKTRPCGAFRVKDPEEADVFFVPFFSSLSYNKYRLRSSNVGLQRKLVEFLLKQEAWNRSKGRDHVVMMHHPNSLHVARQALRGAIFVVADFGRYPSNVANIEKDVVAPYKHIIPSFEEDSSTFHSRPTLLFFQGVIIRKQGGIIRQRLYNILKDEKEVSIRHGSVRRHGMVGATTGMRSSKFCLHLAGDTPSSNRLFDAISSHCVPVIISKNIELPYEDVIDYTQFCLFVNPLDSLKKGFLVEFLRSIKEEEWTRLWRSSKDFQHHFEYQFPSRVDDAVQMIWKSISHKTPIIKQAKHKAQRYSRSVAFKVH